jgi:hypothetical protein
MKRDLIGEAWEDIKPHVEDDLAIGAFEMRFHIHYIEKGDGKITPKSGGKPYNGKRHIYITAKDEASAIRKLKSLYVEDGIKEITQVAVG